MTVTGEHSAGPDDAIDAETFEHGRRCAPLREGPAWELWVRVAIAVVVAGYVVFQVVAALRGPTVVEGGRIHGTLVNHIADGRVTTIDDEGEYVRWRLRDGSIYAERRYPKDVDLRATVAAQPYVRANPEAIRYADIDAAIPDRDTGTWEEILGAGLWVLLMVVIGTGPEPRLATRWGWFWLCSTGVGFFAYLFLSGSRRRTDDDAWGRLTGLPAVLVSALAFAVVVVVAAPLRTERPANERPRPGTAGQVDARR